MKVATLAAVLLALNGAALAETVYLGSGETLEKEVAGGVAAEADSVFADTDAGWYEKLGAGSLTFPLSNVLSPAKVKVALMNGSLRLTKGAPSAATRPTLADAPAVIREKAAFWVDSRTNLASADEASGTVACWYDVRETAADIAAGTTKYPSARTVKITETDDPADINYPKLSEDSATGNKYVNFNGVHSQTAMKFCYAGESSPTATIKSVSHLFIAHRMTTGIGFFWGMNGGNHYFAPGNYKGEFGAYHGEERYNYGWYGTSRGRFWRDGVLIDPINTKATARTEVLEYAAHPKLTVEIANFGCERGRYLQKYEYRCGFDDIGENIVFACKLTEEERLAVSQYLLARWRANAVAAGGVSVVAASDTEIEVTGEADELTPGSYELSGAAMLRKTGGGEASLKRLYAAQGVSDRIRLDGGTLNYEIAAIRPQISAGEKVAATKNQWETLALVGSTGESGTVELGAPAEMTLSDIPDGTEKIVVSDGCLALGEKPAATKGAPAAGEVHAIIPNPNFENGTADWTKVYPSDQGVECIAIDYASYAPSGNWRAPYWNGADTVHYGAPEGTRVMMMRYSPYLVYSKITFPQAGVYDLSFFAAMRADYAYTPAATDLLLFREGETNVVARMKTYATLGGYRKYTFRLPRVEAGEYYFGFQNTYSKTERSEQHLHVDDFKATLVLDAKADEIPVPSGDFERESYPNTKSVAELFALRTDLGVTGWTLENNFFGANAVANPDVAVCSSLTTEGPFVTRMPGAGDRQLVFCGAGGVAISDPFSMPAGTYSLGFDVARTTRSAFDHSSKSYYFQQKPNFQVEVFVNGGATAAATYATGDITSTSPLRFEGASTFDVTATDTLVLRITQTKPDVGVDSGVFSSCGAIDNLRLVKAGSGNLVRNGSFEDTSCWTLVTCPDEGGDSRSAVDYRNIDAGKYYGSAPCDGSKMLFICQWSFACQTIDVPKAGWYKFGCWTRSRADSVNDPSRLTHTYGGNQLKVWWCDEDGEQTNEVYRTGCVTSTNFLEHTAYVKLPAGRIVLGLQGVNRKGVEQVSPGTDKDANLFIDAVSLTAVEAPAAPTELTGKTVNVAKGAKLRLDFDGQVTLKSFGYGAGHRSGVISAARFPEFISGEGSFYVEPKGTILIFR